MPSMFCRELVKPLQVSIGRDNSQHFHSDTKHEIFNGSRKSSLHCFLCFVMLTALCFERGKGKSC